MDLRHKEISISDIDLGDTSFQFSLHPYADASLIQSIDELGILYPVFVRKKGNTYQLLNGFKLLHAADFLHIPILPAAILPEDTSDINCIKIVLATQPTTPSPVTIANIIYRLKQLSSSEEEFYTLVSEILHIQNRQQINDYLLLATLSPHLRPFVEEGVLSLSILPLFTQKIDAETQLPLAHLFQKYRYSFQKQREIITHLYEISRVQSLSVAQFLQSPEFTELTKNETDKGASAGAIRNYIRKKRYPELAQAEIQFMENLKKLRLSEKIQLSPPEGFEGNTFKIQFTFTHPEELVEIIQNLTEMKQNPIFPSIVKKFEPTK